MKEFILKDNSKLCLRWARISDAKKIASTELESSIFENRVNPFTYTIEEFTKIWEDRIIKENLKTVVAYYNNRFYGFLAFNGKIKKGEILALYIAPRYMRLGVATYLMRTAEQLVKLSGGKSLLVEVETRNDGALDFYTRLHFSPVSVKLGHLVIMKKEL